jgi:serine/threonine protein kinase
MSLTKRRGTAQDWHPHRDIKPSNIGFTSDGVPKLLDFDSPNRGCRHIGIHNERPGENSWSVSISTGPQGICGTRIPLAGGAGRRRPPSVGDDLWNLNHPVEACTGNNPFRASTVAATIAEPHGRRSNRRRFVLVGPARQLFADLLVARTGDRCRHSSSANDSNKHLKGRPQMAKKKAKESKNKKSTKPSAKNRKDEEFQKSPVSRLHILAPAMAHNVKLNARVMPQRSSGSSRIGALHGFHSLLRNSTLKNATRIHFDKR